MDTLISIENVIGSDHGDALTGDDGANRLSGRRGHDTLMGGEGDDHLRGNGGRDWIAGGAGSDTLDGGEDRDLVDYTAASSGVTVDLSSNMAVQSGSADVDTLYGFEQVWGSAFDDLLVGDSADNRLEGGAGNDILWGQGGRDVLHGGGGADRFKVVNVGDSEAGAGRDRILDFRHGQGDVIDLSHIDTDGVAAGDQGFTFIGSAAFSGAAQLRFDGSVVAADIDGDGSADIELEVAGVKTLVEADFLL
jgi:Ca2+-binding RTX toxin-like protein